MVKRDSSTPAEGDLADEERRLLLLRRQTDLLRAVLYQDAGLDLSGARELIGKFRERVVRLFPGDEAKFDLLLLPKFDRVLRERWGKGYEEHLQ